MPDKKRNHPKEKSELHPRNRNRERYDFDQLIASLPELKEFVKPNQYDNDSIDFADPKAVKTLNKAILLHHYGIKNWDIPENYLCPPIPGRAEYIHHIAEFLGRNNYGKIPSGTGIKCFDIGVGASCIYPLIGHTEYGWSFIGSDTDPVTVKSANQILESNPALQQHITCKLQTNPKDYFYGIIRRDELIDLSVCNPPFHASEKEARSGSVRKLNQLKLNTGNEPVLNFGGQASELWCDGGEEKFVRNMILQSKKFGKSCFVFSSLISKESNLKNACRTLEQMEVSGYEIIPMGLGNKKSRILVWTFLTKEEQNDWKNKRWKTAR